MTGSIRDRGAADALGLVLIAPAVIGLALLVVALGRGVDGAARRRSQWRSRRPRQQRWSDHASAARGGRPPRRRGDARRPVTRVRRPVVTVDTSDFRPGGEVRVAIECHTSDRGDRSSSKAPSAPFVPRPSPTSTSFEPPRGRRERRRDPAVPWRSRHGDGHRARAAVRVHGRRQSSGWRVDVNRSVSNRTAAQSIAFQAARSGAQQVGVVGLARRRRRSIESIGHASGRRRPPRSCSPATSSRAMSCGSRSSAVDAVEVEVRIIDPAGDVTGVAAARAEAGSERAARRRREGGASETRRTMPSSQVVNGRAEGGSA